MGMDCATKSLLTVWVWSPHTTSKGKCPPPAHVQREIAAVYKNGRCTRGAVGRRGRSMAAEGELARAHAQLRHDHARLQQHQVRGPGCSSGGGGRGRGREERRGCYACISLSVSLSLSLSLEGRGDVRAGVSAALWWGCLPDMHGMGEWWGFPLPLPCSSYLSPTLSLLPPLSLLPLAALHTHAHAASLL